MEAQRRRATRGVDLRHFLALILGLGLLSGIALPAWFGRPAVTLDGAARLLVLDLRTAQNLAVVERGSLAVVFEPDGYRVEREGGELVVHPRTDQPFVRRWSRDAVFRGVRLATLALEDGGARVVFDRLGYVRPGGRIRIAFGDSERTVVVEAPRGFLAVEGVTALDDDDGR